MEGKVISISFGIFIEMVYRNPYTDQTICIELASILDARAYFYTIHVYLLPLLSMWNIYVISHTLMFLEKNTSFVA